MPNQTYSFLARHRLKDLTRCQQLRNEGKVFISGYWRVYQMQNGLSYPRLAIVVAKKYVRLAVKRNLIRRLVREKFRHRSGFLNGCDYFLMVMRTPASFSKDILWQDLDSLSLVLTQNQLITGSTDSGI